MSEDIQIPKQYLLVLNDVHMALLSNLIPGISFIQIEGLPIQGNDTHQLLVNPLPKQNIIAPA